MHDEARLHADADTHVILSLRLGFEGRLLLGISLFWLLDLALASFFAFGFIAWYEVLGGGLESLEHTVVNWQTDIAIGVLIHYRMAVLLSKFWGTHALARGHWRELPHCWLGPEHYFVLELVQLHRAHPMHQ